MSKALTDKLYVNLSASQTRKRLKGHGFGVRRVKATDRNQSVIFHTATGTHLRELESLFADVMAEKEIDSRLIKTCVKEAIELPQGGAEIKPARDQALQIPPQLKTALDKNKSAQTGFQALTIGRQREYAEYIAEAKREDTKIKRLAKIIPMITARQGLNDKYRNC